MISIVTGTLNRKQYIQDLLENTVLSNDEVELVVVDGGSTDGTVDFFNELNHPRVKFINFGKRSHYPHFMNLGILHATHDWICQWNDDVLLITNWQEVINEIAAGDAEFYPFNWKYGRSKLDILDEEWLRGNGKKERWFLHDTKSEHNIEGELVLNFGLYHKKIFKEIGMYDMKFKYYYTDGDMAERAWLFGYKHKSLYDTKVFSYDIPKKAIHYNGDEQKYKSNIELYKNKKLPPTIPFLGEGKIFFKDME